VLIAATRQYAIGCASRQSTTTGAPGDRLRCRLQEVMSASRRHSAVCDWVRQPSKHDKALWPKAPGVLR
jgi:hypothetical protein